MECFGHMPVENVVSFWQVNNKSIGNAVLHVYCNLWCFSDSIIRRMFGVLNRWIIIFFFLTDHTICQNNNRKDLYCGGTV